MSFFVDPCSWSDSAPRTKVSRDELLIPKGSLLSFSEGFHVHSDEDVRLFGKQSWLDEISHSVAIALRPELVEETRDAPLDEQLAYVVESGCSILTPYEIAYLAAVWAKKGRGRLFKEYVRTQERVMESFNLSQLPTVVAFYDREGRLRFSRENPRCKRKDLGVLAGIRRESHSN